MHGKTSTITHDGRGVFAGISSPITATRYHSLTIDPATLPDELHATAHTASGIVMAVEHRDLPLHGVQFHPESVLTEGGHRLLANWLAICGDDGVSFKVTEIGFMALTEGGPGHQAPYLAKGGFLDGWPGLILACTTAHYVFLKYAKLWELRRGLADRPRG